MNTTQKTKSKSLAMRRINLKVWIAFALLSLVGLCGGVAGIGANPEAILGWIMMFFSVAGLTAFFWALRSLLDRWRKARGS